MNKSRYHHLARRARVTASFNCDLLCVFRHYKNLIKSITAANTAITAYPAKSRFSYFIG